MLRLGLTLFITLFVIYTKANALDLANDRFRISGFGTLGLTHAGTKQLGFRKDVTKEAQFGGLLARIDSVLGVQLDAKILNHLSATIQVVAKDRVNNSVNKFLEWAYLRYQVTPRFVIRGGRMGVDWFMLSDHQNVGFAYLWTHPIPEFYAPAIFSHFDGVDLKYTHPLATGQLEFKIYGGHSGTDGSANGGNFAMRLSPIIGANIVYESEHWKTRVSFVSTRFDKLKSGLNPFIEIFNDIPASAWPEAKKIRNQLDDTGDRLNYVSLGVGYDNNIWQIQSEAAFFSSNLLNGYISIGRRFGPFTLYTTGATVQSVHKKIRVSSPPVADPDLERLRLTAQEILQGGRFHQNTLSVGMRWDVHPKIALKAQWDHTWAKRNGARLFIQREPLESSVEIDAFSINLNFIF